MGDKHKQNRSTKCSSVIPADILAQSNHESYFLPEGLEAWADEPLYILVALWCMHQRRWINRNQIASAFRTGGRRASMVLGYILRHTNCIDCQSRMVSPDGKPAVRCCEILVTGVRPDERKRKDSPVKKRKQARGVRLNQVGNAGKEERELLKRLWGRRSGNAGGG